VSFKLTELQKNARRQSESSKVVARRRALAKIAHALVLVQQSAKDMSEQELTLAIQDAQQEAISEMLAIRDM
ncbi:hypothetical protein BGZ98_005239, partial [Dissophora globulifera]